MVCEVSCGFGLVRIELSMGGKRARHVQFQSKIFWTAYLVQPANVSGKITMRFRDCVSLHDFTRLRRISPKLMIEFPETNFCADMSSRAD